MRVHPRAAHYAAHQIHRPAAVRVDAVPRLRGRAARRPPRLVLPATRRFIFIIIFIVFLFDVDVSYLRGSGRDALEQIQRRGRVRPVEKRRHRGEERDDPRAAAAAATTPTALATTTTTPPGANADLRAAGPSQLTTKMGLSAHLQRLARMPTTLVPDREIAAVARAYAAHPENPEYRFRAFFNNILEDPNRRVRPPGVDEPHWRKLLNDVGG